MSTTTPHRSTTGIAEDITPGSRKWMHILLVLLILTTTLNSLWLFQLMWGSPNVITTRDFTIIAEPNTWLFGTKLRIGCALVIAAICFYFDKCKVLLLSALALAWILVEYTLWWYRSYLMSKSAEVRLGLVINLWHGGWWDAWVILLALVLLVTVTLRARSGSVTV